MVELSIDLKSHAFSDGSKIFKDNELNLKPINFIFAKNGSGKSTLVNWIEKSMNMNYQVYVFQGFNSVMSTNNTLDSVVLGEENIEIQSLIEKKRWRDRNVRK